MKIRSMIASFFAFLGAFLTVTAPAYAEDLLGNSTTQAFTDLKDTQTGMTTKVLAVVVVSVAVGLAIRWIRRVQ
jgi:type IV secretory pathway VirB2 component (pilin)